MHEKSNKVKVKVGAKRPGTKRTGGFSPRLKVSSAEVFEAIND